MSRPLVIIHGWSDRSSSFGALRNYLRSLKGAEPFQINLADYVSMDDEARYDDLVVAMQRAWTDAGLPTRPGSVDAVVHSTGGLVIRDWLTSTYEPGRAPVKRLVMLAPANFGSHLAHQGRSFIGRVVKGFNSPKMFQTGARLLKGLEVASPYSWALAQRDRFKTQNHFNNGVLCTVLCGNHGYSGIAAAANQDGSDGTVRAASANLNCAMLTADFATDPLKPTYNLRSSVGTTAFRLFDNDNHSTVTMKDGGPMDPAGRDVLARALAVKDADFAAWCEQCEADTLRITQAGERDNRSDKFGYQNTTVHVIDDAGAAVKDYMLEFYLDGEHDKDDEVAELFHGTLLKAGHAFTDDTSYRNLLVDCTTLAKKFDRDHIKMSLTASPEFKSNGLVGYRTFTDEDIGGITITRAQMQKAFVPHRTLLAELTIRRERAPGVFRIKST